MGFWVSEVEAWPASLREGLGKHSGDAALGYQLRRWSKANSGTGARGAIADGFGHLLSQRLAVCEGS